MRIKIKSLEESVLAAFQATAEAIDLRLRYAYRGFTGLGGKTLKIIDWNSGSGLRSKYNHIRNGDIKVSRQISIFA